MMNNNITDSDIWQMALALSVGIKLDSNDSNLWVVQYPRASETPYARATGSTMMEALYKFYNVLQNGPTDNE